MLDYYEVDTQSNIKKIIVHYIFKHTLQHVIVSLSIYEYMIIQAVLFQLNNNLQFISLNTESINTFID